MTIEINELTTVLCAFLVYLLGELLVNKVKFLYRFGIPAPVVGGLLLAIVIFLLSSFELVTVNFKTDYQSLFMLAFFTTIGLGASFSLVKLGGKLLVIYWLICGCLSIFQNIIGVSVTYLFGIDPLIGVVMGAASMEGGHGAVTAYGTTIEEMGVNGALSIGLASATLGLIAGGLIGGPVVKWLINKYDLKPSENQIDSIHKDRHIEEIHSKTFIQTSAIIVFCMAVGSLLGEQFTNWTGFSLPGYVGAMFLAVIIRNILEPVKPEWINLKVNNLIGDITLAVFLSMALMSIKLIEISGNLGPILVTIILQVTFIVLFGVFVLFKLLGKSYDSAIMVAGFLGHGLGATPNAMANMDSVTKQYGPSRKAFLIVPVVGAFLIDVIAVPVIITTINLFS
ncbi:sodium/glutamate symporter [Macrococcoides caseolyticum]|uniref:sodium/glutamate symporter n=1 Tax=Macrococcoides caseolyticum TaxID=69966 RepID=UPI000C33D32E|nr:sodium/glutamate symporter [Macrococcus caseolyticus]PKE62178.1 sodium/glutamate symporter [Macrococcus caseolyticus]PKF44670.1 sodium/glutamate symporter [Macrococcus caseolyticus]